MADLLYEIGAEEIPAGYIEPALEQLARALARELDAARLSHGADPTAGTPRRLVVAAIERRRAAGGFRRGSARPVGEGGVRRARQPDQRRRRLRALAGNRRERHPPQGNPARPLLRGAQARERPQRGGDPLRGAPENHARNLVPEVHGLALRPGSGGSAFARPIRSLLALLGTRGRAVHAVRGRLRPDDRRASDPLSRPDRSARRGFRAIRETAARALRRRGHRRAQGRDPRRHREGAAQVRQAASRERNARCSTK